MWGRGGTVGWPLSMSDNTSRSHGEGARRDRLWYYDVGLSAVAIGAAAVAFLLTRNAAVTAIAFVISVIVVLFVFVIVAPRRSR